MYKMQKVPTRPPGLLRGEFLDRGLSPRLFAPQEGPPGLPAGGATTLSPAPSPAGQVTRAGEADPRVAPGAHSTSALTLSLLEAPAGTVTSNPHH